MRPFCVSAALTLVLGLVAPSSAGEDAPLRMPEPRVVCAGLEPDGPTTNAAIGGLDAGDTQLLVVGDVNNVEDGVARLTVQQTFYGHVAEAQLDIAVSWPAAEGRRIVLLAYRGGRDVPYRRITDVAATPVELLAARALGDARLLQQALDATYVVVGREVSLAATEDLDGYPNSEDVRTTIVDRVVQGPQALAGRTVRLWNEDLRSWANDAAPLRASPRIFFLGSRGPDEEPPIVTSTSLPPCYRAPASLPVEVLARVQATLASREVFPVVRRRKRWTRSDDEDATERVREIIFRGPVDDMLAMHDADLPGAWRLASRSLILRSGESRDRLIESIQIRMADHQVGTRGAYEGLRRRIRTLADMEAREDTGALASLVRAYLDDLDSYGAPASYDAGYRIEFERTDVNRALVWLLDAIGKEEAQPYAKRLLRMRNAADGAWRRELQIALDFLAVEDTAELLAALERGRALSPPVTQRLAVPGSHSTPLAFAHRSGLLALRGADGTVRLRDPRTWKGRDVVTIAEVEDLAFSPDDRHLYVAGAGDANVARFLVQTGERDRSYEGQTGRVRKLVLSQDGATLATLGSGGDLLLFHDTNSGEVTGSRVTDACGLRRSPDGRGVFLRAMPGGAPFVPFPTAPRDPDVPAFAFPDGRVPMDFATSADGRRVVAANPDWHAQACGILVLLERDQVGGYAEIARTLSPDRHDFGCVAISEDGRHVATGASDGTVRLFSGSDLKERGAMGIPGVTSDYMLRDLAFSADAAHLAVGVSWTQAPGLIDVETLRVARPWVGHADAVSTVLPTAGGRTVLSLGRDRTLCRWHARTLEPEGRMVLPVGFEAASFHPRGDWLLCLEDSRFEGDEVTWAAGREALLMDTATGETTCRFLLSARFAQADVHWGPHGESLLFIARTAILRFDPDSGTFSEPVPCADWKRWGVVGWEGERLVRLSAAFKNDRSVEVQTLEPATGEVANCGAAEPRSVRARHAGLLPERGRFYFASPGLRVYDVRSCQEVLHVPLDGVRIEAVAASPDGRLLAILTHGPFPAVIGEAVGETVHSILRLVDAESGRIVCALPHEGRGVALAWSPDSKRVFLLARGNLLEAWSVDR